MYFTNLLLPSKNSSSYMTHSDDNPPVGCPMIVELVISHILFVSLITICSFAPLIQTNNDDSPSCVFPLSRTFG